MLIVIAKPWFVTPCCVRSISLCFRWTYYLQLL